MKMIIHDLPRQDYPPFVHAQEGELRMITDNGTIRRCTGCFGCWHRTPGICVLKDDYQHLGEWTAATDEMIIISKCTYGSYSPFVKSVLDRNISYMLPYFASINGETHHQRRYDNSFKLTVRFYGNDLTSTEQDTARSLVAANSMNFYSTGNEVYFYPNAEAAWEGLQ